MKKYIFALFAMLLSLACVSEDISVSVVRPSVDDIFYASFDSENDDSRTYLDEHVNLLWHANDCISLFRTTRGEEYRFMGNTGDNAGEFEPVSLGVHGDDVSTNYAIYPYAQGVSMNGDESINVVLPAVQNYAAGSFSQGANTMVATTATKDSKMLVFRNVCGFVEIKLSGSATIRRLELRGNRGEILSGAAVVVAKYGQEPMLAVAATGDKAIVLDCGVGVKLDDEPTSFWLVVPPTNFEQGFTLTIVDNDGNTMTKSARNSLDVARNKVLSMAPFEVAFEAPSGPLSSMAGTWRLTRWCGAVPSFDVYMDISASGEVVLYQRLESRAWECFESVATYVNGMISGVYSDGVAWGASYRVEFSGADMLWTDVANAADVSVYSRASLPEGISASTRAVSGRERFL